MSYVLKTFNVAQPGDYVAFGSCGSLSAWVLSRAGFSELVTIMRKPDNFLNTHTVLI